MLANAILVSWRSFGIWLMRGENGNRVLLNLALATTIVFGRFASKADSNEPVPGSSFWRGAATCYTVCSVYLTISGQKMRAEATCLSTEVEALLTEAQLPVSDISGSPSLNLLCIRQGSRVVGVVGVEVYGNVGMLRSLAVEPASRRSGLGVGLVSNAEAWAAARGVETMYLLTTAAERFFAKLGYEPIARSEAPAAISATAQFSDLCPASSTFMRKALAANRSQQA